MTHSETDPPASAAPRAHYGVGAGFVAVLIAAVVVGCSLAGVALVWFTVVADPCPPFASEGSMAAPSSPYSSIMCDPAVTTSVLGEMSQVSVPVAALIAAACSVLAAGLTGWWRARRGSGLPVIAGVLAAALVAPVTVIGLQVGLPRDCLSGRTDSGDCARDREAR